MPSMIDKIRLAQRVGERRRAQNPRDRVLGLAGKNRGDALAPGF